MSIHIQAKLLISSQACKSLHPKITVYKKVFPSNLVSGVLWSPHVFDILHSNLSFYTSQTF